MTSPFFKGFLRLDLDEKIINISAAFAALFVFLPWLSGEWLGSSDIISHSGFSFYTAFLGFAIFLLNLGILAITLVPLIGGPVIIKRRHRDIVRLCLAIQSVVLILATLSVLTHVTFDFAKMNVRFGIYLTLIASIVTLFESFTRHQTQRKHADSDAFQPTSEKHVHVERSEQHERKEFMNTPPPPPPPPPPEAEDHRLYS